MPTFGFIVETAEERFYERGDSDRPPVLLRCPICATEVEDQFVLAMHTGDAHPITAPRLFVDDAVAIGEVVLHRALWPA